MPRGEFLSREISRTRDAVYGTMAWIRERVTPDVYDKMLAVCEQSVRFGVMKAIIDSERFRNGIEEELNESERTEN